MATRKVVVLVDDMTQEVLPVDAGETINFMVNGTMYEIDLSHDNAEQFRAAVAPYVSAGRRVKFQGQLADRRQRRRAS